MSNWCKLLRWPAYSTGHNNCFLKRSKTTSQMDSVMKMQRLWTTFMLAKSLGIRNQPDIMNFLGSDFKRHFSLENNVI